MKKAKDTITSFNRGGDIPADGDLGEGTDEGARALPMNWAGRTLILHVRTGSVAPMRDDPQDAEILSWLGAVGDAEAWE